MKLANEQNWKIAIHPHPNERQIQNWEPGQPTTEVATEHWPFYHEKTPGVIRTPLKTYPEIQEMGAVLTVDYASGTLCGVRFERCTSYELIAAADCVVNYFGDPAVEAYILGKPSCGYVVGQPHQLRVPLNPHDILENQAAMETSLEPFIKVVNNPIKFKPRAGLLRKWFYKIDRLWWQRALSLAGELMSKA